MIRYISTRGGGTPQTFEQVLLAGLAPDGGLYVPESWPTINLDELRGKTYCEVAEAIIFPFVEGSIEREDFRSILQQTYGENVFRHPDITPLHPLMNYAGGNVYIMEQFHGPTIAFKDVALQLLGRLFDHVLTQKGERITIVGATSGDTGSAAIEGCVTCENIDIFILHPKGRVSDVQRKQMTTIDAPNVYNIAIEGTFDDCQNMVKAMFNDSIFRNEVNLSAVNSINWARIMAQIVYYFTTALKLGAPDKDISFVVPTGNFGNVFAAYCARNMGLPIKTLCVSSNQNDILTRFFETGEMKMDGGHKTLSPSMDIQISSNFERYLFDVLGRDSARLTLLMDNFKAEGVFALSDAEVQKACAEFNATRTDDDETIALIKDVHAQTDYTLDPHTAVGMKGAKELSARTDEGRSDAVVLLATAHPSKFPDAVERAINTRPPLPDHLADLLSRSEIMSTHPNNRQTVQNFVRANTRVNKD